MNPDQIVISLPFDWVGSVIVPVAAVLVSSAIAVGLAALERRAQRKARLRTEVGRIMSTLTEVATYARSGNQYEAEQTVKRLFSQANALTLHAQRKDLPAFSFVLAAVETGRENSLDKLASASTWAVSCLEGWATNRLTPKAFAEAMPTGADRSIPQARLSDWSAMTGG